MFIVGVKYFDTKVDSPDKVITWEFGSGEFSPAVEEALLGMHDYLIHYSGPSDYLSVEKLFTRFI